jgi:hypothetical protein
MDKNNFALGLLIGALAPIVGYAIVGFIFDQLVDLNIMGAASMSPDSQRMRTIFLLSLCCTLIPFNILKRYKWDRTMQGMVFPTIFYAGAWLYKYGPSLI